MYLDFSSIRKKELHRDSHFLISPDRCLSTGLLDVADKYCNGGPEQFITCMSANGKRNEKVQGIILSKWCECGLPVSLSATMRFKKMMKFVPKLHMALQPGLMMQKDWIKSMKLTLSNETWLYLILPTQSGLKFCPTINSSEYTHTFWWSEVDGRKCLSFKF